MGAKKNDRGERHKKENTFSVLQEEGTEPLLEEEELVPIDKIGKDKKKVIKGKERRRIRKTQSKRKGEKLKWDPN